MLNLTKRELFALQVIKVKLLIVSVLFFFFFFFFFFSL
jgi:hypothetical protein